MNPRFHAEDDRHYRNPYEDYEAGVHGSLVNPENDIRSSFKEALKSSTRALLQKLEKNRKHWGNDDGSIYTGIAGVAYLFYEYGKSSDQSEYISRAKEMIERAEKPKGKHYVTFLTGSAGPLAIGAVIYHQDTDQEKYQTFISKLKSLSKYVLDEGSNVPDEMLYGKSGYLYSLLFVNSRVSPPPIDDDLIKKVIASMLKSGRKYAAENRTESPLMYAWHDSEYLGGAHGLAGILYLLLQARQYLTQEQLEKELEPSLQFLLKQRYPSGNFRSSVGSSSDRLVHWCHGAPSMTMLFCLAHQVFGKVEYLETALECGEVVWARGLLKKGYGICHGVSGNAYTFLSLFQETKDAKYLYRACRFAEWCMDHGSHQTRNPDRPFSLFEGLAGTIFFLVDVLEPQKAKFPGYTL